MMGLLDRIMKLLGAKEAPAPATPVVTPEAYFSRSDVWTSVTSSNVVSIAFYVGITQFGQERILGVRFKNNAEYWYWDVSTATYLDMLTSSSKGRFVWHTLRSQYPYKRAR